MQMVKWIFDNFFIKNQEIIFIVFIISMLLMIILTCLFVRNEIKNDNK